MILNHFNVPEEASLSHEPEGVMIVILACALHGAISIFGVHTDGRDARSEFDANSQVIPQLKVVVLYYIATAAWQRILAGGGL